MTVQHYDVLMLSNTEEEKKGATLKDRYGEYIKTAQKNIIDKFSLFYVRKSFENKIKMA